MTMILNRRNFLRQISACRGAAGSGLLTRTASAARSYPVGIGMYAVEAEWNKDQVGTLRALASMGYRVVEFWAPYLNWTTQALLLNTQHRALV
jgi:hypothetical protein